MVTGTSMYRACVFLWLSCCDLHDLTERARREDKLRKERLKNMLGYTEPLNVSMSIRVCVCIESAHG